MNPVAELDCAAAELRKAAHDLESLARKLESGEASAIPAPVILQIAWQEIDYAAGRVLRARIHFGGTYIPPHIDTPR